MKLDGGEVGRGIKEAGDDGVKGGASARRSQFFLLFDPDS